MSKKGMQIVIALVLCMVTAAVTIQIGELLSMNAVDVNDPLEITMNQLEGERARIEGLEEILTDLQNEFEGRIMALGDTELELQIRELYDSVSRVNILAGLTDMSGEGVILTISDRRREDFLPWEEIDMSHSIVHSYQIYTLVNELNRSGAIAISINEERIMPTTEIFCLGGNIRINSRHFFPPYQIRAIGDSDTLHRSVIASDIYSEIVFRRLTLSFERSDDIFIPRYIGDVADRIELLTETEIEAEEEQRQ